MRSSRCLLLLSSLLLTAYEPRPVLAAVDENLPYGRVSIAGSTASVVVHLRASVACTALVVPLRKDGTLANGWTPQLVELSSNSKLVQVPKLPAIWRWTNPTASPFDFYVAFIPVEVDAAEFRKLVTAMPDAKAEERLVVAQTNKLRELLGRIAAKKEPESARMPIEPELAGIIARAAPAEALVSELRKATYAVNFTVNTSALIVIPSPPLVQKRAVPGG